MAEAAIGGTSLGRKRSKSGPKKKEIQKSEKKTGARYSCYKLRSSEKRYRDVNSLTLYAPPPLFFSPPRRGYYLYKTEDSSRKGEMASLGVTPFPVSYGGEKKKIVQIINFLIHIYLCTHKKHTTRLIISVCV